LVKMVSSAIDETYSSKARAPLRSSSYELMIAASVASESL